MRLQDASGKTVGRETAGFSVVVDGTDHHQRSEPGADQQPDEHRDQPAAPRPAPARTNETVVSAAPGGIAAALVKVRDLNRQGKAVRLALQPTTYREIVILLRTAPPPRRRSPSTGRAR